MKTLRTSLTLLNPPKSSGWAAHHRGTPAARGYGYAWGLLRERVLERDSGICQPSLKAGYPHPGNECDHIIPKSQGGTDAMANLQCICNACHKLKTQSE